MMMVGQSAFGFALIGPVPTGTQPDAFQTAEIGYRLPGDIGTPKLAIPYSGYRRNVPVLYYSFDSSFWEFFGPSGVASIEQAFAVFNNLTNVSMYSSDLSEFPFETERINYVAQAMTLLDLKSATMGLLTEQLGLMDPTRWVWALHDRVHIGNIPCPVNMEYLIIKRNYDLVPSAPDQYQTSSYVNNVLYTYGIEEFCAGVIPLADAVEFSVDPLATQFTAVADWTSFWYAGLELGGYYTGLTRDDVGGLRFLMRSNNIAIESSGPWSFQFVTNFGSQQLLTTFSLAQLSLDAATNDDAALSALYPGLQFSAPATINFTNIGVPNVIGYFTNSPWDPAGTLPHIAVIATNGWTTNIVQFYVHHFANLVTNSYSPKSVAVLLTTTVLASPTAPAGSPGTTNTQVLPFLANIPTGEFYILPTNACDIRIIRTQLTTVTPMTNLILSVTFGTTNTTGTTTTSIVAQATQSVVTYATNHTFVINVVTCPEDTVDRRQGIEKITFVRRDYDSLVGQTFNPITNYYSMVALKTNAYETQYFRRRVPRPDFLFTVADTATENSFTYSNSVDNATETLTVSISGFGGGADVFRNIQFNQANRPGNQAGPGTIEAPRILPTLIIFDDAQPMYINTTLLLTNANAFISEATHTQLAAWGTFDGSTNLPTVYPNGTDVTNLENMLLMSVTTTLLPDATVGIDYTTQLAGTGGTTPYTWSLSPNPPANLPQGGLPAGLTIASDGTISGTPTAGTGGSFPASSITYDFTVRMTDVYGRYIDVPVSLTVNRQ